MTDNRDDLLWFGASLCRAKDRAAAAERRVEELEAAMRQAVRLLEYPSTVQDAATARTVLLAPMLQDAPEPPTLPDPVPARPEVPGVCWACGGQNPECGVCLSKLDP